jgi:hypothetical protein
MPVKTLLLFILLSFAASAQKNEKKAANDIYASALRYYYKDYALRPMNCVVTNCTINWEITQVDYSTTLDFVNQENKFTGRKERLDSSWAVAFLEAEKKKNIPTKQPLYFNALPGASIVAKDSIDKSFGDYNDSTNLNNTGWNGFVKKFGWRDHIELSGIIFLNNKAIVEISCIRHEDDGEGLILFLQKVNKEWIVVSYMQSWVA